MPNTETVVLSANNFLSLREAFRSSSTGIPTAEELANNRKPWKCRIYESDSSSDQSKVIKTRYISDGFDTLRHAQMYFGGLFYPYLDLPDGDNPYAPSNPWYHLREDDKHWIDYVKKSVEGRLIIERTMPMLADTPGEDFPAATFSQGAIVYSYIVCEP